ncbi:2',3'-cyclic-nucleotide 3'-phosphodiesterase [Bagarius yarrelli]|uniref:2',3'-cyclic-nucleotide 3'-phosphodiesterase n=1 Tax=Bagarius yarrelli TaxID=175774 RepID=A0A556TNB7_BAGYA|nr:2',3'-cyclic-nucleotide 3'-phosphodiesterase [Bagarius yarrelli]
MEADQNQEVPEAVAQTLVAETELPITEQPESEEANEIPSAQEPPEPENLAVDDSKPDTESTEQTPEVKSAKENVSPETATEPEKSPEREEVVEEVPEKAVEVQKIAEEPSEVKDQAKIDVVEQQIPEPANKAETEEKVEPEEDGKESQNEAVPTKPVNEAEEAEVVPTKKEAQEVQAEPPKEEAEQPKESVLPMFYGWFLLSEVEEKIKCSTMEFLKNLDTLEAFKKHIGEFTGDADKEVDLEQYFQNKMPLHCTSMFCDYGKVEGAKEYAELQVVKDSYGTATELSVVGLIVTPRVFGARVALTPEQLLLWPAEADKVGIPPADLPGVQALPVGSRAHVTLGCAEGVEGIQTGIDLLEILILQQGDEKAAIVEEMELGTLSYLGQGRWYLALREPVTCDAEFSSFSKEQPTEPAKKESGEKKKKLKCSIL